MIYLPRSIVKKLLAVALLAGCAPGLPAGPLIAAAPSAADAEPSRFGGMLEAHNKARRALALPELQWSAGLARSSQGWADSLRRVGCGMEHSEAPGLGENLAWASGTRLSPVEVAGMWLEEARDYNLRADSCRDGEQCGHYTQMVWRSTRFVGCGMAQCGRAEVWVCHYNPPGNYVGQRPY